MKKVLHTVLYILGAVLAAYLITHFVGMRAVVDGISMEETLYNGENLIVDKVSYRFRDPARFDIVICPGIPEEDADGKTRRPIYIKRIIGLPGETIGMIGDDTITIDGRVLEEDVFGVYKNKEDFKSSNMLEAGPYQLKDDEYFLMGDNRYHSRDSRDPLLGPVKREDLIGKVWVRIWPLSRLGGVR